jgi:Lipocalin-like domain
MKLRITFSAVLGMLIGLGLSTPASNAQTAKDIVGPWTLVSVEAAGMDGSKSQPYGANPVGIIIFDASGNYSNLTSRAGLPKFASNNRTQGTPEESKAIVQGSIAHFGKYSVNEADKASSTLSTAPTPTGTAPNRNAQSL